MEEWITLPSENLADGDNWTCEEKNRYSIARFRFFVHKYRSHDRRYGRVISVHPGKPGIKYTIEKTVTKVTTNTYAMAEAIKHCLDSRLCKQISAKMASEISAKSPGFSGKLGFELFGKTENEVREGFEEFFSAMSSFTVSEIQKNKFTLEIDVRNGCQEAQLRHVLWPHYWDFYLYSIEYLDLEYRRTWFWPEIQRTIRSFELAVLKKPLFRLMYYEQQEHPVPWYEDVLDEIEDPLAKEFLPLERPFPCDHTEVQRLDSLEVLVKLAFPVSKVERRFAEVKKSEREGEKKFVRELNLKMAYARGEDMMFGTAKYPVTTKRGIEIGGGFVHPEVVPHPRPGSEKTMKTLLREYEKANGDALERMTIVGHPTLQIENEHVFQMTHNPKWGGEIAAQTAKQMDEYLEKYGLKASYRSTIADLRKPDMHHMRDSDYTMDILESFKECSKYADVVSIESMGGKEIFDHAIIRNDIAGILFGIGVLGAIDMEWMWDQIVAICKQNDCIPGGDTNCSEANTAMFMAGGMTSKDVPHVIAALSRAISASRTMIAYECGATGPTKDCAYEDPIIKAMTGVPISTEGKVSACAHSDLASNIIMAVCDLWSNEAVEYHDMFGATTTSVFAEILGYDCAILNTSLELGYQEQMKEILVNSDMYRDSHSLILAPDNAWEIGNAIVSNRAKSNYASARAGAIKAGQIIQGDAKMKLTALEKDALDKAMKDLDALPDAEGDFIDQCLDKYKNVPGFNPDSYGL